ncbi:hypothetical protein GGI42DRAFT_69208 [Trichoderma sp. SZMC 28013]
MIPSPSSSRLKSLFPVFSAPTRTSMAQPRVLLILPSQIMPEMLCIRLHSHLDGAALTTNQATESPNLIAIGSAREGLLSRLSDSGASLPHHDASDASNIGLLLHSRRLRLAPAQSSELPDPSFLFLSPEPISSPARLHVRRRDAIDERPGCHSRSEQAVRA